MKARLISGAPPLRQPNHLTSEAVVMSTIACALVLFVAAVFVAEV